MIKKDEKETIEIEALTTDALDVSELDRRLELALATGVATWGTWCPKEATKLL
jgi:hypothetical protein